MRLTLRIASSSLSVGRIYLLLTILKFNLVGTLSFYKFYRFIRLNYLKNLEYNYINGRLLSLGLRPFLYLRVLELGVLPVPVPVAVELLLNRVEAPVLGGTVELLLEPLLLKAILLLGVIPLLGVVPLLGATPKLEVIVPLLGAAPELEIIVLLPGVVLELEVIVILLPLLEGALISSNSLSKLLLLLL